MCRNHQLVNVLHLDIFVILILENDPRGSKPVEEIYAYFVKMLPRNVQPNEPLRSDIETLLLKVNRYFTSVVESNLP